MKPIPLRRLACALLLPLLAAGCGDEAESADPPASSPAATEVGPFAGIPVDSLYGATAIENLRVARVEIPVPGLPAGWDGMRVAAISDFKIGLWEENGEVAAAAVRRAVELDPDLIVLLGDYVSTRADTADLSRALAPLRGRRALAVLGDADVRTDSMEAAVTRTLRGHGVEVLVNEVAAVERNGATAYVGGLDAGVLGETAGEQSYRLSVMGGEARVPLLLTHAPPLAARAPDGKFGVVLAGNTVCGEVEVPGTPRLSWLNTTAIPGAVVEGVERLYRVSDATLFVTCGTGFSFVPARFALPPEVALVTLRVVGAPTPDAAPADSVPLDTLLAGSRDAAPGG